MANSSSFFPPDIASIIDVTDYGAVGDAVIADDGTVTGTDNTAAFVAAIRDAQPVGAFGTDYGHWVYIPAGRFMVSDRLNVQSANGQFGPSVRFVGEHIDVSDIVLKHASPGYTTAGTPKPLFYTASLNIANGNSGYKNGFQNLTITVGAGNPGAVGIDMNVSNTGGLKNVRIRSVDPNRAGIAGLALTRVNPGPALFETVTVDGFNVGIDVATHQYSVTFEHVTLRNQLIAGLRNSQNVVPVRDLRSHQTGGVPGVLNTSPDSFTTVLDSILTNSGGTATVGIDNSIGGYLRLRAVRTVGYTTKLSNKPPGGSTVTLFSPTQLGDLDEFTNGAVSTLFSGQRQISLRLPVMEPPEYYDNNPSDWANVMDYGAVHGSTSGDQAPAIQAALNSGKSTIYFPAGPPGSTTETNNFSIRSPLTIPGTVKRIAAFMSIGIVSAWPDNRPVFTILDETEDPLFIENTWFRCSTSSPYSTTTFNDAVLTAGSNVMTSASANFTSPYVGRGASDISNNPDTAIPPGTVITSVTNANTVVLSANATVSGTRQVRTGGNVDPNAALRGGHFIEHGARRPLILNEVTCGGGTLGAIFRSGCGPVHIRTSLISFTQEPGTRVWARALNMESPYGKRITNNGGDLWCLGLKIEQFGTVVKTMNGGRTEVEGGFNLPINPDFQQQPGYECVDASHSLSFSGFAYQQYHAAFDPQVRETRAGVTRDLTHAQTVKRYNSFSDVVPLHVGRLV